MTPLSLDQPWGRGSSARHSHTFGDGRAFPRTSGNVLPRGLGRSYGDVCVNDGGTLMHTFRRDRLLAFDDVQGRLTCEAGALLADIAQTLLPRGWFLPVVPGTRFVTVGGAIANDVHGKNHHISGTFGRAVRRITLRRSDSGVHMLDAPNPLLAHTIGGLGLTGMIEDVTLQLSRVPGPGIAQETTLFGGKNSDAGIDDYLALRRRKQRLELHRRLDRHDG
jgi:FAD/FMN-containing dehydrogenase